MITNIPCPPISTRSPSEIGLVVTGPRSPRSIALPIRNSAASVRCFGEYPRSVPRRVTIGRFWILRIAGASAGSIAFSALPLGAVCSAATASAGHSRAKKVISGIRRFIGNIDRVRGL
ncbi:MAG: hypothetical protein A4E67_00890 [Syntrophaceae bacterium PtaB.Bin038]|nr:MAG: hypothetical protein A4E67_00890 [Syntrophaceae bacterium PtaB.Bin038]